ncbi:MAG: methionyl-tRNA formyltransferase [Woeseiaceae bacterium]|nr:methionyl-tRNA formyltransferase [Woeseiaceae bacterium]
MRRPRIVFAGTPDFARASLASLVAADRAPVAVLTQPDRPAGRGKRLTASPVKKLALEHDIEVLQPATLKGDDVVAELAVLEPDLVVVAAYGLLLPQRVLDIPRAGCLNVHASLLPRWRGAAPIQAAILAGDTETGVCLMQMTAGLDSGPVYACEATAIGPGETAGELHDRLAALGADLLVRELDAVLAGDIVPVEQDEELATHAPKIGRTDAALDWNLPADSLARRVRAFNPVPGAWFMLDDEAVKCWQAQAVEADAAEAGRVLAAGSDGIVVACAGDALRLTRLQRPGRRPVSAREFAGQVDLAGRRL